jgi:hypothetical protein
MDFLQANTLLWIAVGFVYILPAIIAVWRGHPLRWPLTAANLLFGWTLVGYAVCLIIAVWPRKKVTREW